MRSVPAGLRPSLSTFALGGLYFECHRPRCSDQTQAGLRQYDRLTVPLDYGRTIVRAQRF